MRKIAFTLLVASGLVAPSLTGSLALAGETREEAMKKCQEIADQAQRAQCMKKAAEMKQ